MNVSKLLVKFSFVFFSFFVVFDSNCNNKKMIQAEHLIKYKGEMNQLVLDSIADRCWAFVPETNENALIGNPRRIMLHNSIVYIYDDMNQVLAFDTTGKHQFTIHNIGGGPGEYSTLSDVAIDYKNNKLLLYSNHKLIYYNLDGTYAGKEKMISNSINELVVDGDVMYEMLVTYSNMELSPYILRTHNMLTDKSIEYLPTLPEYAPFCLYSGRFLNHIGDGNVYFTRKFDQNIYKLAPDSYVAKYSIDWGKSLFVPEEGQQYECSDLFRKCLMEKKVMTLFNFQEGKSYLTLSTNLPGFYFGNKKNNELYKVSQPFDKVYNIPMNNSMSVDGCAGMFVFVLNYSNVERRLQIPQFGTDEFRELFSKLNDDTNPIMVFYKLK